jgi:4-hydroxybenzoate polyprenyltransferase
MNLSPYLSLARIDKPIGTALLFYPCLWALALLGQGLDFALILYFGIGSFLMRSAGCIIKDLVDAP